MEEGAKNTGKGVKKDNQWGVKRPGRGGGDKQRSKKRQARASTVK